MNVPVLLLNYPKIPAIPIAVGMVFSGNPIFFLPAAEYIRSIF